MNAVLFNIMLCAGLGIYELSHVPQFAVPFNLSEKNVQEYSAAAAIFVLCDQIDGAAQCDLAKFKA
jgi:hypothetical protein